MGEPLVVYHHPIYQLGARVKVNYVWLMSVRAFPLLHLMLLPLLLNHVMELVSLSLLFHKSVAEVGSSRRK